LNAPNLLTLSRFLLIPIYLFSFFYVDAKVAFFVLLFAGLTDILDGYLARSKGLITQLGEMLDPLADKSMMLAVIISLLVVSLIPWQAAVAIMFRDIGLISGSVLFHIIEKKHLPSNFMGKATTFLFYLAIMLLIWENAYAVTFLWFVIVFSFITAILYLIEISKFANKRHE
jgi:cardiolipin synthase